MRLAEIIILWTRGVPGEGFGIKNKQKDGVENQIYITKNFSNSLARHWNNLTKILLLLVSGALTLINPAILGA